VDDYKAALRSWMSGQNAAGGGGGMPESFRITPALKRSPAFLAAADRIKAWTRARFGLPEDGAVMVSQVSCSLPGCPPLETIVAFWTGAEAQRHHFKIFKPVEAVLEDDLPPAWLKPSLRDTGENDLTCC
jgi:nitrate reductase delta subunit